MPLLLHGRFDERGYLQRERSPQRGKGTKQKHPARQQRRGLGVRGGCRIQGKYKTQYEIHSAQFVGEGVSNLYG